MTPSNRRLLHILYWFMVFMGLLQATRPLVIAAFGIGQEVPANPTRLARTTTISQENLESPMMPQNRHYKSITKENE